MKNVKYNDNNKPKCSKSLDQPNLKWARDIAAKLIFNNGFYRLLVYCSIVRISTD